MSRIRTIKPDAFRSETLSEVSVEAERTFFGLITEVDDDGRIKERPAVLNGALWSLRPEHTVQDMKNDLTALVDCGLACRYDVDLKAGLTTRSDCTRTVTALGSDGALAGRVDRTVITQTLKLP